MSKPVKSGGLLTTAGKMVLAAFALGLVVGIGLTVFLLR